MTTIVLFKDVELKHPRWRNDKLISDAHKALNLLIYKGYLKNFMGYVGRVKEVDGTTCKITFNTEYDSKVICALLKLYFPNRIIKEVT